MRIRYHILHTTGFEKFPLKKIKIYKNNYIQALGLFYNYECFN